MILTRNGRIFSAPAPVSTRAGVGITKPISSVPLFFPYSIIVKTNVFYWISSLYLGAVDCVSERTKNRSAGKLFWCAARINCPMHVSVSLDVARVTKTPATDRFCANVSAYWYSLSRGFSTKNHVTRRNNNFFVTRYRTLLITRFAEFLIKLIGWVSVCTHA